MYADSIDVSVSVELNATHAQLRLKGPADVWFAVAFSARAMADQPWALVANASGVMEQQLGICNDEGQHCGGTHLAPSVTLVSNAVTNSVRTLIVTRPLKGLTPQHYSFDAGVRSTIPLLAAVGSSSVFAYHAAHAVGDLNILGEGEPTCLCLSRATAAICDNVGENCQSFMRDCSPDVKSQRNPTCSSATYGGGLACCRHRQFLLDADQSVRPEVLRYHLKFRIWFQEYRPKIATAPASHLDLIRYFCVTEAGAGEYDVPPAFAAQGKPIVGYPGLLLLLLVFLLLLQLLLFLLIIIININLSNIIILIFKYLFIFLFLSSLMIVIIIIIIAIIVIVYYN
jgi:hypothetical protein